jgi:hypothetical protein
MSDARMRKRGSRLRLLPETADAFLIDSEMSWQDFKCDLAPERKVQREVNLTHSACAKERTYFITA